MAVLPFTCIGDVSPVAPLADGINEDLRVSLGRFGDLPVIGMQQEPVRILSAAGDELSDEAARRLLRACGFSESAD